MINEYITRNGRTEDGDYIMLRTIEVDSIAEAKEVTKSLQDEVTRGGSKAHYVINWKGKGGGGAGRAGGNGVVARGTREAGGGGEEEGGGSADPYTTPLRG